MPLTAHEIRRRYGRRIHAARDKAGYTQAEVAARLTEMGVECSPQAVSRWEVGAVAPRLRSQHALLELLGPGLFDLDNEAA